MDFTLAYEQTTNVQKLYSRTRKMGDGLGRNAVSNFDFNEVLIKTEITFMAVNYL